MSLNPPAPARLLCLRLFVASAVSGSAQSSQRIGTLLNQSEEWFRSEEGRRTTDNVLSWQSPAGSWPKNQSTTRVPYTNDASKLKGTFDNGATTDEIRDFADIEAERRNGYAWYGTWGEGVATDYERWSKKWLKAEAGSP